MSVAPESRRLAILAPLKQWGGLERKFTILADEFVRAGLAVDLVCLRGGEVPYPDQFPSAVRIINLATRSKRDGVPAVMRYLRDARPEAVLTAKDHAAQVALIARMLAGSPARIYVKTTNMPSEVVRRPVQRWMARRLYRRADRVIAISDGVREDLVRHFNVPADRVVRIYNPMLTRDFAQRLTGPVDLPWPDNGQIPLIMGAGRLTRQKDFSTLIRAFARVRQARPARLLIAGEGVERPVLEQLATELGIAEDVALPGAIPDPVPCMRRADVFVLSSRYEGLGNVLIEAMAAGSRLVSTDCPSGPAEILEQGRQGALVPVGDEAAMAQAILRALDGPKPDPTARAASCERFAAESVGRAYLATMGMDGGSGGS